MDIKRQLNDSIKAAHLEFKEEPMDAYYRHLLIGFFSRWRVKRILKEVGNINGKRGLDVGCEAGYVSIKLFQKGAKVVAFDVCFPALLKFKQKLEKMSIQKIVAFAAIAQEIPLKSNSVDFIVCTEVIEHMPLLNKVFDEFARVLKPYGKLIITFPNESLRKKLYPIIKLFGINTDVEKDVTLFSYNIKNIAHLYSEKFLITKIFTIPPLIPLTNFIICRKK